MEFNFPFDFTTFFLFLAVLLALVKKWNKPKHKLPPGPSKLPLIGSLHHLMGSQTPHQALRDLARKYGPLMHLQLCEISVIVVSSPRFAEEIMKTHDLNFSSRPQNNLAANVLFYYGKDIANCPYGHYWRQTRKICVLELLSAKRVRSFGSTRLDETSRLLESIRSLARKGNPINLSEKIVSFSIAVLCRAAFGENCKDQHKFYEAMEEAALVAADVGVHDLFPSRKLLHLLSRRKPKLEKIHRKIDRYLEDIMNVHRENLARTKKGNGVSGDEDLVDVLLRIQESGDHEIKLEDDNVKAIIFDMFGGGSETTTTTMEWAMSEMMRNPKVMAKAQSEIRQAFDGKKTINEGDVQGLKYLKLVIKETLRLHPPAPLLIPRECIEECEIDGYIIPPKTQVWVNAWALGIDPEYWQDPESFNPERFEDSPIDFAGNFFQYIPFGGGRRICPGISFTAFNLEIALASLLYHFDWKLPNGMNPSDLDMTEKPGMGAKRNTPLYLVATPSTPSI